MLVTMQEAYRLATNGDDKVATHQVLGDGTRRLLAGFLVTCIIAPGTFHTFWYLDDPTLCFN